MRKGPVLLSLALVVGCHHRAAIKLKDVGPAELGQGWASISSADGKVSIGIPNGWGKAMPGLTPSTAEMGGGDQAAGTPDPQMGAVPGKLDEMNSNADASGADGALITVYQQGVRPIVGEQTTRYYIRKNPPSSDVSFEDTVEMKKTNSGKPSDPQPVELPIGSAKVVTITRTLRDGGVTHEYDYYVQAGEDIYEVTFITESDPAPVDQIREGVMKTLRIRT